MNMTIAQWLNTLVPMPQIVGIVNQVLPGFVLVAVMRRSLRHRSG
jgi:hypothetical protein